MKKSGCMIVVLLLCLLYSCSKEEIDGDWSDHIRLSTDKAEFPQQGGASRITTEGTFWWLESHFPSSEGGISLIDNPDVIVKEGKIKGWDNPNVIYDEGADMEIKEVEGGWFRIEKDTYTSLTIVTQPNTTGKDRWLDIRIQGGNYFTSLRVFQSAE